MLLIIIFIIFIISLYIFKDDEKILYKIFFIILGFSIIVVFFKYTKYLGEKIETKQKKSLSERQQQELIRKQEEYENYVKEQVSNIVWKIPN